jgi:hypothetical protein
MARSPLRETRRRTMKRSVRSVGDAGTRSYALTPPQTCVCGHSSIRCAESLRLRLLPAPRHVFLAGPTRAECRVSLHRLSVPVRTRHWTISCRLVPSSYPLVPRTKQAHSERSWKFRDSRILRARSHRAGHGPARTRQ